jgi:hypothetical protein
MLATTLNVGEHFAIIVVEDNLEGDDFWIFICEKTLSWLRRLARLINYWG